MTPSRAPVRSEARLPKRGKLLPSTSRRASCRMIKKSSPGKARDILVGRYEKSLTCLDRAIDPSPNYPFAHVAKGISLQALGRHRESMACLDEAIELKPDYFAHATKERLLQGPEKTPGVDSVP